MGDVVFRTSGSTGAAKEIVRRGEQLDADAAELVAAFPEIWAQRPPVVTSIPVDHLYGALWRVRAPRCAGSEVSEETVLSVEALLSAKARYGRFLFVTTPSFLEKALLDPEAAALSGAFVGIVISGNALRRETAFAALRAWGVCPIEIYGSTEAGTVAWRRQADGGDYTLMRRVEGGTDGEGRLVVASPYAMTNPLVMSDAVRFVSPRQFVLLGRADRRVKILESFVSLPAVESALESHPLVACARAEAMSGEVPRIGALVVLNADGRARLLETSHAGLTFELRRELLSVTGRAAFPRRIRFVRALPVDVRGKTTVAAARAALGAWCREPVVLAWREASDRLTARLVFPADLECFDGHFPGLKVLPGVAQLYFLRHFARQVFADFPEAATWRRLKFQKLVLPGREVELSVSRIGEGQFEFSLDGETGRCASGRIERSGT